MSAGTEETAAGERPKPPSLLRDREFLKMWSGETISVVGSQFSQVAIPILAVKILRSTSIQLGVLQALALLPFPLFGLFVGVWADRHLKRPTMIAADLGRMFFLGLIPLSAFLFSVTMNLLYLVVFAVGTLQAFFDISYQAYLPHFVRSDQLVEGNSRLTTSRSAAAVVGPSLAGIATGIVGAPMAIFGDVLGYLGSATFLSSIKRPEPRPEPRQTHVLDDIKEGLHTVFGNRHLTSIALTTGTSNLFSNAFQVVAIILLFDSLGFTSIEYGAALAFGGLGAVLASLVVMRYIKRVGVGNAILTGAFISGIPAVMLYFANVGDAFVIAATMNFITFVGVETYNVAQVSYRQALVPLKLQGRMNASMRVLVWGPIPAGALLGGVLGAIVGIREAVLIAALGGSLPFLWILSSPVRRVKVIPQREPAGGEPSAEATSSPTASPV